MKQQLIKTCNGKAIKKLYVVDKNDHISYQFSRLSDKLGVTGFSLSNISDQYQLEVLNRKMSLSEFKIIPGIEYKISNSSYGDAASSDIQIKVGLTGTIEFASKTTCR